MSWFAKNRDLALDDWNDADSGAELSAPLSWRLDPKLSLSDWSIRVTSEDGDRRVVETAGVGECHVHKQALAVGPRACLYFAGLFRTASQLAEGTNNRSDFQLPPRVVQAFPAFLDFVYSGRTLEITTDSAVPLLYLADYLRCKAAWSEAQNFVRGDLRPETSARYFSDASGSGPAVGKLAGASLRMCASNFSHVAMESLQVLSPQLFVKVISSDSLSADSHLLSRRVTTYLQAHATEADGDLVCALTGSRIMPTIAPAAAVEMLAIAVQHDALESDGLQKINQGKRKRTDESKLTLKDRCLTAIHGDFRNALPSREMQAAFEALPTTLQNEALRGALDVAHSQLDREKKKGDKEKSSGRRRKEKKKRAVTPYR